MVDYATAMQIVGGNTAPPTALPDIASTADVPMSDFDTKMSIMQQGIDGKLSVPETQGKLDSGSQGLFSRIGSDWDKRKAMGETAADAYVAGNQSLPETYGQVIGKTMFGGAGDVLTEGAKSAVSALPDNVKNKFGELGSYLANEDRITSPVYTAGKEALTQGVEAYGPFAKDNPRTARNIEAGANILGIAPIGKLAEMAAPAAGAIGEGLSRAGAAIADSADARVAAKNAAYLRDLITPKLTPTVVKDQFGRSTEKGLFNKAVVEPTPQELSMIDTLSTLPVSGKNSLLRNANIIEKANKTEAEALMNKLKTNDIVIDPAEVDGALAGSMAELKKNPFITGDAETSAQRVIDGMNYALQGNNTSVSGLLQARRDFDNWVKRQKGKGVFDPQRDSAVTTAVQNVRQTLNNFIEQKVPDAGYKASLKRQSNMYRALDAIETKAGMQAKTSIGRAAQKIVNSVPAKGLAAKSAILGGLGTLGYAAPATIPLMGAGVTAYGLYRGGKAMLSPSMQKGAGVVMDSAGRILQGQNPFTRSGFGTIAEQMHPSQLQLPAPAASSGALPAPYRPYVGSGGSIRPMTDDELAIHNMSPPEQQKRMQKVPQSIQPSEIEQISAMQKAASQWDMQYSALSKQGYTAKEIENNLGKRPVSPNIPQDYGRGVNQIKARGKNIADWDAASNQFAKDGLTYKEIISKIGKRPDAPNP